jgi:hypothetical protein
MPGGVNFPLGQDVMDQAAVPPAPQRAYPAPCDRLRSRLPSSPDLLGVWVASGSDRTSCMATGFLRRLREFLSCTRCVVAYDKRSFAVLLF